VLLLLQWESLKYCILLEFVFALELVIQHAMRMHPSVLSSSVVCPFLTYSTTLSHKQHDFRKKKLLNTKVCSLQLFLSETFFVIRKIQRDIITKVHRSPCKVNVIIVRF
jgi:hypothetical protein